MRELLIAVVCLAVLAGCKKEEKPYVFAPGEGICSWRTPSFVMTADGSQVKSGEERVCYAVGGWKLVRHWKSGKLHGPYHMWYEGGVKKGTGFYAEGKPCGLVRVWSSSGKLEYQKKNPPCPEFEE